MGETGNGVSCELIFGKHVAMGWGCGECRRYNGMQRVDCKACNHPRCTPLLIPEALKTAVYCEEGGRWKVEIVTTWFEVHEKSTTFALRLRGIETLQRGNLGDIPPGHEFTVSSNVEYMNRNFTWVMENL